LGGGTKELLVKYRNMTTEELLGVVFSVRSVKKLYNESQQQFTRQSVVSRQLQSNMSTEAEESPLLEAATK
jgi:hypothetical protein